MNTMRVGPGSAKNTSMGIYYTGPAAADMFFVWRVLHLIGGVMPCYAVTLQAVDDVPMTATAHSMWLFHAHNAVNARLGKKEFPDATSCAQCKNSDGTWDDVSVVAMLSATYRLTPTVDADSSGTNSSSSDGGDGAISTGTTLPPQPFPPPPSSASGEDTTRKKHRTVVIVLVVLLVLAVLAAAGLAYCKLWRSRSKGYNRAPASSFSGGSAGGSSSDGAYAMSPVRTSSGGNVNTAAMDDSAA